MGVELANKEIRLVQVSSNKANQWVLDKLYIHPVEVSDDSTPIENADKFTEELKEYSEWYDGESVFHEENKIRWIKDAIKFEIT